MHKKSLMLFAVIFACKGNKPVSPLISPIGSTSTSALQRTLVPLPTCDTVSDEIRARLAAQANAALDAGLNSELSYRKERRQTGGDPCQIYVVEYDKTPMTAPSAGGTAQGAKSYSTTNNQVANVDEADVMKNDASRIYVLSGSHMAIVGAFPTDSAAVLGNVPLLGSSRAMLLSDTTAIVFTSSSEDGMNRCTYGYDCDFSGDGSTTQVAIYDVTTPSAPVLHTRFDLSGSYITARRINDEIHIVTQFQHPQDGANPVLTSIPNELAQDTCASDAALTQAVEELKSANIWNIRKQDGAALVPSVVRHDFDATGKETALTTSLACEGFYATSVADSSSVMSVISFHLGSTEPASITSVIGEPGPVMVADNDLFVASRYPSERGYFREDASSAKADFSAVHRFDLTSGHAAYADSAFVKGLVLNQFSMDAFNGALRVASTAGRPPGATANYMSTLSLASTKLAPLAELTGFGASEDIRSVRFDGAHGYVVTFKKTDPLFAFDLSDPAAPKLSGELQIPGFSTYMHLLDDTHLLTIGYDANDEGSYAWFNGILLQIFDVSNPQAPKLASKIVIGTRGSGSEALTDHLAFNYFAPKKLLALPMTICAGGGDGQFGTDLTFNGTQLYSVDATEGLALAGQTSIGSTAADACYHWWTDSQTNVRRTVFMDDTLWSITDDAAIATSVQAPGTIQKQLTF